MPLTMSLVASGLTQPLLDGTVRVSGAEFDVSPGKSVDDNSRQMLKGVFDVAEMSIATFLKAWERGGDLLGLPIFTGRRFLHPAVLCNVASGIDRPEDFRGKRVGLPQFWMTSSIWHRGILQQQHGVSQDAVRWYTAVQERFEDLRTPPGVSINALPEGRSLNDALLSGEIDAVMTPGRGGPGVQGDRIKNPYGDLVQAQRSFFTSTGVFPIMHFVVMRRTLAEQQPGLAGSLFSAFVEAKRRALSNGTAGVPIDELSTDELTRLFGADPYQYGLAPNRRPLGTFLDFARGQGWSEGEIRQEDLFVPSTLDQQG